MKRGDDNDLERKLRLEKVVARLAMETEEERRARLEKAQVGPGDRGRKKSKKWIEYYLDLICIEIGFL